MYVCIYIYIYTYIYVHTYARHASGHPCIAIFSYIYKVAVLYPFSEFCEIYILRPGIRASPSRNLASPSWVDTYAAHPIRYWNTHIYIYIYIYTIHWKSANPLESTPDEWEYVGRYHWNPKKARRRGECYLPGWSLAEMARTWRPRTQRPGLPFVVISFLFLLLLFILVYYVMFLFFFVFS